MAVMVSTHERIRQDVLRELGFDASLQPNESGVAQDRIGVSLSPV
jgi:hypothetical protein